METVPSNSSNLFYVISSILIDLQAQDPQFYALITSTLSPDQQKGLNDVILTAEQKKAQYTSKQIQKQGGNEQQKPLIS